MKMNLNKLSALIKVRFLSTSTIRPLIQKWRQERGLPLNPNASGILTDKPDYTYLDGRTTPYGTRQKNRIMKQKLITRKIIDLTMEVDLAVEIHKASLIGEEEKRKKILGEKLKPKGNLLLKT